MPQLQINQGPQDALLYDNSRSYFTNVGYVRTSNFQVEYRDVDPQSAAQFGGTVNFVIPKAADLLGPVDLTLELPVLSNSGNDTPGLTTASTSVPGDTGVAPAELANIREDERVFTQWVDELGFAMIEKATFKVASEEIESLTGEQMQIKNELMTSDEQRLGWEQVMKAGRAAFSGETEPATPDELPSYDDYIISQKRVQSKDYSRIIGIQSGFSADKEYGLDSVRTGRLKRKLVVPLQFFFTKHVSQYFPLAAIAGCNDIRIEVKLRSLDSLVQLHRNVLSEAKGTIPDARTNVPSFNFSKLQTAINSNLGGGCKLRTHFVHVTGPEATTLMNKEHVRLLKLWKHTPFQFTDTANTRSAFDMDLQFLHPVSTLIVTIRRTEDFQSRAVTYNANAAGKGHFFYHGDGMNPNYDADGVEGTGDDSRSMHSVKVDSIKLTLNGQERHPGLSSGIEADYLRSRLIPALHSNSNLTSQQKFALSGGTDKKVICSGVVLTRVNTNIALVSDFSNTAASSAVQAAGGAFIQLPIDGGDIWSNGPPEAGDEVYITGGTTVRRYTVKKAWQGVTGTRSAGNGNAFASAAIADVVVSANQQYIQIHPAVTAEDGNATNGAFRAANNPTVRIIRRMKPEAARVPFAGEGSKNIFVYPFSLNPEGSNPAGAVNFSKVSHAKLTIKLADKILNVETTGDATTYPYNASRDGPGIGSDSVKRWTADVNNESGGFGYTVDVYALYWNWLQVKDGRALLSFA